MTARAHITVDVYRAPDGLRWRIQSAARGRRIISESSEAYVRKSDAFRGLLLTTGGRYLMQYWTRFPAAGAFEQGVIRRTVPWGDVEEEIFVQYSSAEL